MSILCPTAELKVVWQGHMDDQTTALVGPQAHNVRANEEHQSMDLIELAVMANTPVLPRINRNEWCHVEYNCRAEFTLKAGQCRAGPVHGTL